eukprot:3039032-Lingulodinium_polyedra.AAC.1
MDSHPGLRTVRAHARSFTAQHRHQHWHQYRYRNCPADRRVGCGSGIHDGSAPKEHRATATSTSADLGRCGTNSLRLPP